MATMTNEAARAAWQRADDERAFWLQHQQQYLEQYPDQFVAVKDGTVVATGANLDQLLARLEGRGLEPTQVWLRYFDAHPTSTFF
jgi:hypothetical protein